MKYVVEFDRDEMLDVLVALDKDADHLEGLALGQPSDELHNEFMQMSRNRRRLYNKIVDTFETVE